MEGLAEAKKATEEIFARNIQTAGMHKAEVEGAYAANKAAEERMVAEVARVTAESEEKLESLNAAWGSEKAEWGRRKDTLTAALAQFLGSGFRVEGCRSRGLGLGWEV